MILQNKQSLRDVATGSSRSWRVRESIPSPVESLTAAAQPRAGRNEADQIHGYLAALQACDGIQVDRLAIPDDHDASACHRLTGAVRHQGGDVRYLALDEGPVRPDEPGHGHVGVV